MPDTGLAAALTEQASALSRELHEEQRRLNRPGVDSQVELSSRLQNARQRVDRLVEQLGDPDVRLGCVARALALERARARSLFGECFDVAIRSLVRGPDVGRGACEVADVLLRAVAQRCGITWPHFTSIAAADFVTAVSHIVRLAYPPSPIWSAAIAVHELGHYCGPNWPGPEEDNPYETFLTRVDVARGHREELFADMFAVYTVGPAFVLACLGRLSPAGQGDAEHPPDTQRATWILAGLDALAESAVGDSAALLRNLARRAGDRWDALCRACGAPPPDGLPVLQDEAERLFDTLRTSRPDAMYADVRGALAVRASYENPAVATVNPHPIDVLNAAWFLRRGPEHAADMESLRRIEQWGGDLIRGFSCR